MILVEFPAFGTSLGGKTLSEIQMRQKFWVSVVGIWERGQFSIPNAGSRIERNTVLVIAGKNLAQSKIRKMTGCSTAAIKVNGVLAINPDPQVPIQENAKLILIGTYEREKSFLQWTQG